MYLLKMHLYILSNKWRNMNFLQNGGGGILCYCIVFFQQSDLHNFVLILKIDKFSSQK